MLLCVFLDEARSSENQIARLIRGKSPISGFQTNTLEFSVVRIGHETQAPLEVLFWGVIRQPVLSVSLSGTEVRVDSQGVFRAQLPLLAVRTAVEVQARTQFGIVSEQVIFEFPRFDALAETERPEILKPHTSISMSLGITPTFYAQPGVLDYNQMGVTAKIGFGQSFAHSPWSLGANVFATVGSALVATTPALANEQLRFLGANLRLGYRLPFVHAPWSLNVMVGIYYTTTFSSALLGYENLGGPQLFPYLTRKFPRGDSLSLYFKFSPVAANMGLLSLDSREIAAGSGYAFVPNKNGTFWSIHMDLASLNVTIPATSTTIASQIQLVTSSFSLAFHL